MVTSIIKCASVETFRTFGKTLEISRIFSEEGTEVRLFSKSLRYNPARFCISHINYFIQRIKGARKRVLNQVLKFYRWKNGAENKLHRVGQNALPSPKRFVLKALSRAFGACDENFIYKALVLDS